MSSATRSSITVSTMTGAAFNNPSGGTNGVNSRAWRAAEIPAANGHGTARSLARIYGALARGGEIDGTRILEPASIELARSLATPKSRSLTTP